MKLKDFIKQLSEIKSELQEKEIVIKAENGLLFEPTIKFIPKDIGNLSLDSESIDKAIITIKD